MESFTSATLCATKCPTGPWLVVLQIYKAYMSQKLHVITCSGEYPHSRICPRVLCAILRPQSAAHPDEPTSFPKLALEKEFLVIGRNGGGGVPRHSCLPRTCNISLGHNMLRILDKRKNPKTCL